MAVTRADKHKIYSLTFVGTMTIGRLYRLVAEACKQSGEVRPKPTQR
jgi:hypothetical protein